MPKFNSAYFQTQILKNQIAVDVAVANNTRINEDTAATIDVSANSFLYITATADIAASRPTAAATNNGAYYVATDTSVLSTSNGSSWSTVNSERVIFTNSSNASYANKAYTTNGSGVLSAYTLTTHKLKTNTTQLFSITTSNNVSAVPPGRYFVQGTSGLPATIDATDLLNIAYDVTNGTYTTVTELKGDRQLSSTNGYLYSSGTVWQPYNA